VEVKIHPFWILELVRSELRVSEAGNFAFDTGQAVNWLDVYRNRSSFQLPRSYYVTFN
jgi:hypothetical protein